MRQDDEQKEKKIVRDEKGRFDQGTTTGGAPFGSKNAQKLNTPELQQEAYRQYCDYIATGGTKEAWVFDHPTITITWETMENYIRNDPINFDPIQKKRAEALSYLHWLGLGKEMMVGEIPKCQPAIYQMFMRNKFGWDKESRNTSKEVESDVRRLLQKIEGD